MLIYSFGKRRQCQILPYIQLSPFTLLYSGENVIFWENGNLIATLSLILFQKNSSSNTERQKKFGTCQNIIV